MTHPALARHAIRPVVLWFGRLAGLLFSARFSLAIAFNLAAIFLLPTCL